jgi:cytochrome c oxidase assembly protein subunit 15
MPCFPVCVYILQEPENKHEVPRVSPYRLAAHLTSAFAIYATLVWTTLDLARPQPVLSNIAAAASAAGNSAIAAAAKAQAAAAQLLRGRVLPLSVLVGVTAVSGAFVAGLDAGRAFNTFPLMNGQLIPDEYWGMPGLRNAFENTAAVQLHHRALALSTLAAVSTVWVTARTLPLPHHARLALNVTALLTAAQVGCCFAGLLAIRLVCSCVSIQGSLSSRSSAWLVCLVTTGKCTASSLRMCRTLCQMAKCILQ